MLPIATLTPVPLAGARRTRRFRTLATAATAVVAAATAASFAGGAEATVKRCGAVAAGGWTFQVGAVNLPDCASARALTKKLAGMGLPSRPTPYPGVYLKMHCFGVARKTGGPRGAQIQCTSGDGRKSLISVALR